jgi:acetyltransferase-like isoleucine patch superfamily enzyme
VATAVVVVAALTLYTAVNVVAFVQDSLVVAAELVRSGVNVMTGMMVVSIVLSNAVVTANVLFATFTSVEAVGLETVPIGAIESYANDELDASATGFPSIS